MARKRRKFVKNIKPRKKVEDAATSHYRTRKFSKNIQDIVTNKTRYRQMYSRYGKQYIEKTYLPRIYEQLGMHYFADKDDFYTWHMDKAKRGIEYTPEAVEEMWRKYKHRNELIVTGQFQEAIAQQYKDNYIKYLERVGMSDAEIQNIRNMPLRKWIEFAFEPEGDSTNYRSTALPPIDQFNYDDNQALQDIRDNLEAMFEERGWVWGNDPSEYIIRKYSRSIYGTKLTEEDTDYDSMLAVASTKLRIYTDKQGNEQAYIPFVGSTRGKNKEFIYDVLEYKKNH